MGEIVSLIDKLREKNDRVTYEHAKFPIFEGKVIGVPAILSQENFICSLIDFLPTGLQPNEVTPAILFTDTGRQQVEEEIKKLVRRVVVPFSVHPEVIMGANVRGSLKDIAGYSAYVLEVLKDETISDDVKVLSAFTGQRLGSRYEGFQYIVPI